MPRTATAPLASDTLSVAHHVVFFCMHNAEEHGEDSLCPERLMCCIRFARERLATAGIELPHVEMSDVLEAMEYARTEKWLSGKRINHGLYKWATRGPEFLDHLWPALGRVSGLIHTAYGNRLCSQAELEAYRQEVLEKTN